MMICAAATLGSSDWKSCSPLTAAIAASGVEGADASSTSIRQSGGMFPGPPCVGFTVPSAPPRQSFTRVIPAEPGKGERLAVRLLQFGDGGVDVDAAGTDPFRVEDLDVGDFRFGLVAPSDPDFFGRAPGEQAVSMVTLSPSAP